MAGRFVISRGHSEGSAGLAAAWTFGIAVAGLESCWEACLDLAFRHQVADLLALVSEMRSFVVEDDGILVV